MSGIRWTVVVWSARTDEPFQVQSFGLFTELARAQALVEVFRSAKPKGATVASVMPIYPERTRKTIIQRLRHIGYKLTGIN